jgi:hypothetical protein
VVGNGPAYEIFLCEFVTIKIKIMKRVIRIGVSYLLLMNLFINGSAQNKNNTTKTKQSVLYSIGVEEGIATGSFRDTYRYSLGGSIGVDIPVVSTTVYVTASGGFQNLYHRTNGNYGQKSLNGLQLLPLKAGIKYFPVNIFYVQGEAGAAFLLNKSETDLDRSAVFIYAPQLGAQFRINRDNWVDVGLRYEHSSAFQSVNNNSKVNLVCLKAAYTFALRRW